jgi:hypothetical protein
MPESPGGIGNSSGGITDSAGGNYYFCRGNSRFRRGNYQFRRGYTDSAGGNYPFRRGNLPCTNLFLSSKTGIYKKTPAVENNGRHLSRSFSGSSKLIYGL